MKIVKVLYIMHMHIHMVLMVDHCLSVGLLVAFLRHTIQLVCGAEACLKISA